MEENYKIRYCYLEKNQFCYETTDWMNKNKALRKYKALTNLKTQTVWAELIFCNCNNNENEDKDEEIIKDFERTVIKIFDSLLIK